LKVDHVRPYIFGHSKEPGNVVRLCGACNAFKCSKDLSELTPEMAHNIQTAAAQFKEYWESGCAPLEARPVARAAETPKALDPALLALLRAVECGDDSDLSALAKWLEERGDPRANAIRELTELEAVVRDPRTGANGVTCSVDFLWHGIRRGTGFVDTPSSPGDTDDALAQRVRESRRRHLISHELWQRLGLTCEPWNTLKQYLGINPTGVTATIEEIAQREVTQVQIIRLRIDLALHCLTVPSRRD
jgi:hypothetical protein